MSLQPHSLQHHVFRLLDAENSPPRSLAFFFDIFVLGVILLNVLAIILESVTSLYSALRPWFLAFELFSVTFFSIEYVLRVWTITCDPRYAHPLWGRLRYMLSFMALVDLLAILPFFIRGLVTLLGVPQAFHVDMRFLRIMRIFKVVRYISALRIINNVFRRRREELFVSLIFILFILLIVSCLMYFVEHEAQPEAFSSIPATMWWGVATLTTVGYGDMYPITPLGKVFGGMIAILGIGLFALPAGILAAGCAEEIQRTQVRKAAAGEVCPHCGRPFDAHE